MVRTLRIGAALAMSLAAVPASAGSWGVGFGYGGPIYDDAPPRVLLGVPGAGAPPMLYEEPNRVYRRQVPLRSESGVPVLHMEAPEDVLDRLASQGFHDMGRITRRGARYMVKAVNRRGDLVALQISIFTGRVERAVVLSAGYDAPPRLPRPTRQEPTKAVQAAPRVAPPPPKASAPATVAEAPAEVQAPASKSSAPASTLKGRLKVPPTGGSASAGNSARADRSAPADNGQDPLVVY